MLAAIDAQIQMVPATVFEVHAGAEYRDFGLASGLRERGCDVVVPTEGMRIGEQLSFYRRSQAAR